MKPDRLADLSLEFGIEIMRLSQRLADQKEYVASNQLCKSGTSIGANIREAHYAQSKADFISKLQIALKETHETYYWLELLRGAAYLTEEDFSRISTSCNELRILLVASINTAKSTQGK